MSDLKDERARQARRRLRAKRAARRERRSAVFSRPLDSFSARLRAWTDMLFVDHGVFRLFYVNWHRVGAQAHRSAQPAPRDIARFAAAGVRTIVSLRGGHEFGSYPLEREACRRRGLAFREITLRSREAPSVETIEAVAELLHDIAYPALFHCKSGADRAGLMSALYLLLREGATIERAQKELALRFGHVRQAKTGVLDVFLELYADAEAAAKAQGETLDFMTWVRRDYDPKALAQSFQSSGWRDVVLDRVLARE